MRDEIQVGVRRKAYVAAWIKDGDVFKTIRRSNVVGACPEKSFLFFLTVTARYN